jgi:hypothetical protein
MDATRMPTLAVTFPARRTCVGGVGGGTRGARATVGVKRVRLRSSSDGPVDFRGAFRAYASASWARAILARAITGATSFFQAAGAAGFTTGLGAAALGAA